MVGLSFSLTDVVVVRKDTAMDVQLGRSLASSSHMATTIGRQVSLLDMSA